MATRASTPILLALSILLFPANPAPAAAAETPLGDLPVLALEDEEPEAEAAAEEVEVEEVCEEVEEDFEECEEAEAAAERDGRRRPEECVLRSARAHASLDPHGRKLKLTIGYTTYEPAKAKIEVGHIATLQRHLGRSGVLRIVKPLRKNQHLKRLVVRIGIPSAKRAGCPSRRLVLFPR